MKMPRCLGFGEFWNVCTEEAIGNHRSIYWCAWCARCNNLRMDYITAQLEDMVKKREAAND